MRRQSPAAEQTRAPVRGFDAHTRPAVAWWRERTPRERRLLRTGTLVAGAALFWSLGLKPAIDSIAQSRERLPRLHADAALIDALVLEAQALQRRQSGRMDAAALPQALRESLRRAELEDAAALSTAHGIAGSPAHGWEIAFSEAGAARVMDWLAVLPPLLHVRIVTVELSRSRVDGRDRPGHVSGRIVLQLPAESRP